MNQIYLSGGMSGLTMEEQTEWRKYVIHFLQKESLLRGSKDRVSYYNPPEFFNFEEILHKTEREVFEYDITRLKESKLVIVNFNNPNSLGTAMELIVAKEYGIPVIGLNVEKHNLHPWLIECCTRIFEDMDEMLYYVADFHLPRFV